MKTFLPWAAVLTLMSSALFAHQTDSPSGLDEALGGSTVAAAYNGHLALGLAVEAQGGGLDGQLFLASVQEIGMRSAQVAKQLDAIDVGDDPDAGMFKKLSQVHQQIDNQARALYEAATGKGPQEKYGEARKETQRLLDELFAEEE